MGRVIITQAVASAGQFVLATEPGSSKGPKRSKTVQTVASVDSLCLPGNLGRVKARSVRRLHKL